MSARPQPASDPAESRASAESSSAHPRRTTPSATPTALRVSARSESGDLLLLVAEDGSQFTLAVDEHLRAQVSAPATELETSMESSLRPRDIQARIRAGASPEQVAGAAGTTVERIMPFAGPVLDERAHIAERAQASSLRRRGEGPATRPLGEVVARHLQEQGGASSPVAWDAWRRDDGRWTVTVAFETSARRGTATFVLDLQGRYVLAESDDARWLAGEAPAEPVRASDDDDLRRARRRREGRARMPDVDQLAFDAQDELPGFLQQPEAAPRDVPHPPVAPDDDEPTEDLGDLRAQVAAHDAAAAPQTPETPTEASVADQPERPDDDADDPKPKRPSRRARGRASVPSWDEIMFGGGQD